MRDSWCRRKCEEFSTNVILSIAALYGACAANRSDFRLTRALTVLGSFDSKGEQMLSLFDQEMTMLEQNELAQHESVIERGIQTFVEVGASLMEIRDKRLYRRTHSSF